MTLLLEIGKTLGDRDVFNFPRLPTVHPFPLRKSILYGLICVLWLSFGIIGRDPWKPEETILVAWIANIGYFDFGFLPLPSGSLFVNHPPLYLWLASLTAKIGTFMLSLPIHEGARFINVILIALGFLLIGFSVHQFFGLRVAWLSILLLVGTTGFMIRGHLLGFGIASFFGVCVILASVAVMISPRWRLLSPTGGVGLFLGLGFVLWSVGGVLVWCLALVLGIWSVYYLRTYTLLVVSLVAVCMVPLVIFWVLTQPVEYLVMTFIEEKWAKSSLSFLSQIIDGSRVMLWSLFPLLPLVVVGLYNERDRLLPFSRFCWLLVFVLTIVFFLEGETEEDLYSLLPPLSILAARSLQNMTNEHARLFDFFALLVIGALFGGGVWLLWWGLYTEQGWLLDFFSQRYPNFSVRMIPWWQVGFAALLTLGWLSLMIRLGRSNERVAVNWSVGITLIWALTNLLLVSYIDSVKSYRHASLAILGQTKSSCLRMPSNLHWRAQLYYFGVNLGGSECDFYLDEHQSEGALWSGGRYGKVVYNLHHLGR